MVRTHTQNLKKESRNLKELYLERSARLVKKGRHKAAFLL